MSNDIKIFEALKGNLRTGLSADGRAYVVRNDLADEMKVKNASDLTKGMGGDLSNYHGEETIETPGGPQKVSVLYKRGVFHVLMVSRKPEAMAFKDRLFDFLEEYEREGFVVKDDLTPQQSIRLIEKVDYKAVTDSLAFAHDYRDSGVLSPRSFANMQNGFYKIAIGTTASDFRRKHDLPKNAVVKDHLTDAQLSKLQGMSMMVVGQIRARYPNGIYSVQDFVDIYHEVIQSMWDNRAKAIA
jgi:prophage antirepressor-like protein